MITERSGNRQARGRIVLFSYGWKSVQSKATARDDSSKQKETSDPNKTLDYTTLLSWYNDNNPAATKNADESAPDEQFSQKQRNLKFILL